MQTVVNMPSTQNHDSADAASALPEPGRHHRSHARPQPAPHSPFVPLLLGGLALLGWLAFQTQQLANEREQLQATHAAQQQTVDNAAKLRGSLDALAADTQRMADTGNPNAKLLVEELRKRGITINPQAAAAAKPPTTP